MTLFVSLMISVLKKSQGKYVLYTSLKYTFSKRQGHDRVLLLCVDEEAIKREQTLQIDVAFIIHGSKNITSPPRKKTFKDALDWVKKITGAFGEIGANKTLAGLILYAEEAKLMLNFTANQTKSDVMEAIEKASSPPPLGNKTYTGKALKLCLKTLVKETRNDAVKKFFVFTDRPPDDDPMSAANAIKEENIEVYGLGGNTPPSSWYIHDFGLDSMYEMLKQGPFKGGLQNCSENEMLQHSENSQSSSITSQSLITNKNASSNPGNKLLSPESSPISPGNSKSYLESQALKTKNATPNTENIAMNSQNIIADSKTEGLNSENLLPKHENQASNTLTINSNSRNLSNNGEQEAPKPLRASNAANSQATHEISGSISEEKTSEVGDFTKENYGNDASVIITENNKKSSNSLGRYSSAIDINHSATQFGTVIGGLPVNGQSKFDVVKPNRNNTENFNFRSKLSTRKTKLRNITKFFRKIRQKQ